MYPLGGGTGGPLAELRHLWAQSAAACPRRRSYTLDQPRSRMGLYRTVLAEGQRQDLIDFLNRDLLLAQWPVLRTLISRPARHSWEAAFPELTGARTTAAALAYEADMLMPGDLQGAHDGT
ncbi:transcriptional regulator [Streptomyces sp. NPDC005900]|uniref:transcriptional regulator n=1 Tax=Streptomyces sp. NPDC005900 TaxID=3154569 RepID=UPI0033F878D5